MGRMGAGGVGFGAEVYFGWRDLPFQNAGTEFSAELVIGSDLRAPMR